AAGVQSTGFSRVLLMRRHYPAKAGTLNARHQHCRSMISHKNVEVLLPFASLVGSHKPKLDQRVMKFVGIINIGPYFVANSLDCSQIERAKIRSRFRIEPSPLKHSASPPLFKRRVVEKSIRPRVQNFLRERRSLDYVACDQRFFAALD